MRDAAAPGATSPQPQGEPQLSPGLKRYQEGEVTGKVERAVREEPRSLTEGTTNWWK